MSSFYGNLVISAIDISDTTAEARDVASGKYFYTANGTKTEGTATGAVIESLSVTANGTYTAPSGVDGYSPVTVSIPQPTGTISITQNGTVDVANYANAEVNVSGGGEPTVKKQINFIDYDGTILHSYTSAEWTSVAALPSNPSHAGLIAQGWNWTKAQIDAQLTAIPDGDIWVGQMYITDDGKTRIYIHLEESRLHPYLGICPNGTVVVDWGDGSATSTLTGSSLMDVVTKDHVYASGGDYMITLTVSSGSFSFYGISNTTFLLRKDVTTTANVHRVYSNAVRKVEIGINASIGDYAFRYCSRLTAVTIPSGVTSIGTYAFAGCYDLGSVTIPNSVTSIGTYAFSNCSILRSITMPNSVTSISNFVFLSCNGLVSVTIPNGVMSINNSAFSGCNRLVSVNIPNDVMSIDKSVFINCVCLASVNIPNGVTSISNTVFSSCYSLGSVTIPNGVTSIAANAFYNCYGLGEIHFKPATPPTVENPNAWTGVPTDCKIYVPTGSLSTYTSAENYPSPSTYTYIEE